MKTLKAVFAALFILSVPVTLLLTCVQLVTFNRGYYRAEYEKYGIPQNIGMSMADLMDSTEKLLAYLDGKREDLNFEGNFAEGREEFFSERDKLHMVDVRQLFIRGRLLRNFSLLYAAAFILYLFRKNQFKPPKKKLACYGMTAAAAGIIPVLILVVLMNIDFYKYFTIFHEIFFSNDLWLLDPANDRLVNIFPQDFFTDMAFSISYLYIGCLAAIFIASLLAMKLSGNKQ